MSQYIILDLTVLDCGLPGDERGWSLGKVEFEEGRNLSEYNAMVATFQSSHLPK